MQEAGIGRKSRQYWEDQLSEYWESWFSIQEYSELKKLPITYSKQIENAKIGFNQSLKANDYHFSPFENLRMVLENLF